MDQLGQMRLFVRVVETGSFSKTGVAEGVAQSTVSKEISSLEGRLGAELIRRSSRGLSVTAKGRDYYDFAVDMLTGLEKAEARIRSGEVSPTSRVRLAAPPLISDRLLMPKIQELFAAHPNLSIDMDVSERYVNLVEDGFDVAIRVGELSDSSLRAQKIGCVEAVVVASPAYLGSHGVPETPAALRNHICLPFLFHGASKNWKFVSAGGPRFVAPLSRLRTNDAASIRTAVLAGLGLAQGPSWVFAEEIAKGAVVPVLANYAPPLFPIHAVSAAGRRSSSASKIVIDYVIAQIDRDPHLRLR